MKITDIIPDFSNLSDAEVENLIRQTRKSRTTTKEVTLSKRPTKEADKSGSDVAKQLAKLNPEQLALLKKALLS